MWKEHEWNDKVFTDFNTEKDYGIYQIYGDHPVYGENILLYIGKANQQNYSTRLSEHSDLFASHLYNLRRVHLSYFCEIDDIKKENWGEAIDMAEKILINAHMPVYNAQNIKGLLPVDTPDILICNWGERGRLLPEVSSLRHSGYYWDSSKFNDESILKE
jgi:hypothetical protein